MVKDGTNRGGRRVRAGAKPGPLGEKLAAGRPATPLEDPLNEPFEDYRSRTWCLSSGFRLGLRAKVAVI